MSQVPLLDRLRQNNSKDDWDLFFELYGPLLNQWAIKITQPDLVEDLQQEVSIKIIQKLPSYRGTEDVSFLSWLKTILRHQLYDMIRRRNTRSAVSIISDDGISISDPVDLIDNLLDQELFLKRAMHVMQTNFESTTWKACWESVVVGRPAADIAVELNISVDSVYSANYRVIRKLKSELEGLW